MQMDSKATATTTPKSRAGSYPTHSLIGRLLANSQVLLLALAAAVVVGAVRFFPAYDYPHWIYQAHVLANLADYRQWFELQLAPTPNLGSTLFLWPLTLIMGTETAGRVLISIYAALTVIAFAYVVRSKGARSGLLLLGPMLVFNYFFYNGFLSYFLGLPLVLFTVAVFERTTQMTARRWVALTLLSVLAYLCHLFVWFPIAVYAAVAGLMSGRVRGALALWSTQFVSVALLAVYTLTRTSSEPLRAEFYKDIPDKAFGLITPMLPLSRVDPFPSRLPFLPLNMLFAVAIAALFIIALRYFLRSRPNRSDLVLPVTVALLLLIALLMPVDWFAGMRAFDKRITFMGFALLLAVMGRYVPSRLTAPVGLMAVVVLGLHYVVFAGANSYMTSIHEAMGDRPQGASLHVFTFRNPPMYAACNPTLMSLSHGVFPLQWFPLFDVVERDHLEVETFETALLRERPESVPTVTFNKADDRKGYRRFADSLATDPPDYDYLVIFGCPDDLEYVADVWADGPAQLAQPVNRGPYHVLLRMQ